MTGRAVRPLALAVLLVGLVPNQSKAQSCSVPSYGRTDFASGSTPSELAFGDFNWDGRLDLAVGQLGGGSVYIQLGDGAGGFGVPLTLAPGGSDALAVVDFNRDGRPDILAAASASNGVAVLLATGPGTFGAPALIGVPAPKGLAVADFNSDGILDIVAAVNDLGPPMILGNGFGGFSYAAGIDVGAAQDKVVSGDFNRDGHPDVAFIIRADNTLRVFLNDGLAVFTPVTPVVTLADGPESAIVGDFNRDGRPDVAVASDGTQNVVGILLGDGAGGFSGPTNYGVGPNGSWRLASGDLDGDGDLDIAVTHDSTAVTNDTVGILLGDGMGGFAAPLELATVGNPAAGVAIGDVNRDGRSDMVVTATDALPDNVSVFLNQTGIPCAAASFGPAMRAFSAGNSPYWTVSADFNSDGRPDLATTNYSSNDVTVHLGNGAGELVLASTVPVGTAPIAAIAPDLNGDGRPDLVTANYSSANLSVRLGDGSGGFGSAPNLSTGDTVFSLVAADFNSDGRTDFVGSNPNLGTLSLFRGNGDGTFAAPTSIPLAASAPVGLALADMNRDGGFDVVVADWNGAVWVLLGDGAGGFSPVRTAAPGTNPYFVDVADFNGDDRPDVLVSNQTPATVSLFMGNGSGGLGAPTQFPTLAGTDTRQVAAVDVNGDRRPDVVLAGMTSPSRAVFVLLGDGSGGLGAPAAFTTGHYPSSFAAADFTGDGVVDLAVAASNVAILAGNGAGGFEAPIRTVGGGSGAPYRPLLADFNRDGRLDLAARGGTNQLSVYLGDGFGGFGGATNVTVGDTPRPIAADLDGNGTLDLATANLGDNNVSVVLGNGDGTFAPAVNYASGTGPMSLAPMDVDRDGRLDLVVSLGTGSLRVLRGLGGGNFGAGTTIPLSGGGLLAVGDLDGNGTGDVVVQQAFQSVAVVLGDGFGGFSSTTLVDAGTSTGPVALSDLNRDGRLDLVVGSDLNNVVAVLLGDGLGGFGSPSLFAVGLRPVYLAIGDVNADGRADIVASGGSTPTPGMVAVLLGDGAGGFSAPKGYQAGGGAPSVALGDVNRDGRTDVVLANGTDNSYWTLLNSNCKTRGMLFTQNVSSCNLPSTPFASQPVLSVVDDGANVIQCAAGNVGAQIMWNTGTPGATLGGTIAVSPVAGVATYTDLSVNFVGSGYQLLFTHAGARNAWSRRFNVGAPVITGAASFCQTASVVYDVGAGYESYAWTLDGGPVLSRLRNVTLSGVSPGLRELMVTVTQAECTDTQTLWVDVGAALSGVSIAMIGADGVCPTCTGGTASVTDTGGGSTTHQWGYRTVSGGTITAISGQTGSAYQLNGANFPGVGSYFLVVTTTPSCGSATVSNEIPVSVYTTVVGDAVVVFTVTSKDGGNTLEWLNPAIGVNYAATRIQYNVGSPACTAPSGPFAGTHLVRRVGSADAHDMTTHSGLTNGTSYCYAAFVEHAGLAFGDGRPTKGRPFDTTNAVKWAFSTGATTMAPPAIGPAAIYSASNDLVLHGMVRGLTGSAGLWPAGWRPYLLDQPTHHRMGVGTTDVVLGSSRVAFLGSQDGYVYAVDADTGVERWQSGVRLGDYVETAPVAMLQGFGGIVDQVYAGSENSAPPNAFYALNAANGVVVSAFDNGGGTTAIGAIVGGGAVDYALNRVYFTSHEGPGGANRTLWCLGITGGGLVDNCGWPPLTLGETDLGNVDNAPTLRNGVIYVGNTTGTVYAVDALTRTERWHYDTLDGAVKGFVFPDRNSNRVYFATEGVAANPGHVWGLVDNGVGLVALAWPSVAISAPSIALFTPGGTHILVGSDDGQLHQLDVSGGPPATTSIQLGDGSAAVGSPSYDPYNNCVYAGSEAGVIYAVELPLP